MIEFRKGDVCYPCIRSGTRFIIHVCNDQGGWGAGFTRSLSRRWERPEAYYREWHQKGQTVFDGLFELGNIQNVLVERNEYGEPLVVTNMIAQHGFKSDRNPIPLQYDALALCLVKLARFIRHDLRDSICTLHMPRIGTGLAGGEWHRIERLLLGIFKDVPMYVYDLG